MIKNRSKGYTLCGKNSIQDDRLLFAVFFFYKEKGKTSTALHLVPYIMCAKHQITRHWEVAQSERRLFMQNVEKKKLLQICFIFVLFMSFIYEQKSQPQIHKMKGW